MGRSHRGSECAVKPCSAVPPRGKCGPSVLFLPHPTSDFESWSPPSCSRMGFRRFALGLLRNVFRRPLLPASTLTEKCQRILVHDLANGALRVAATLHFLDEFRH